MKKALILGIVALVVLLPLGALYRQLQILEYPIGTGDEAKSPDGGFVASVTEYYDESFWGTSHRWVEFEISRAETRSTVRKLVTEPIPGAVFGSRTDTDVVFWSPDSKQVEFMFPGVSVTLKVEKGRPGS